MKKNILLFFSLIFTISTYACTCGYGTVSSRLNSFENVFIAKVVKVIEYHENSTKPKKIKIEVLENFNQEVTTNILWFSKPDGMCPIPNPKSNSKWLFYISPQNGILSISACNPSISFNNWKTSDELSKIRFLNKIKETHKDSIEINNALEINSAFFQSNFSRSKRYTFDNDYGLYLVNFEDENLTVKSVESVKSLGVVLDEIILEYYKNKFKIQNYSRLKSVIRNQDLKLPVIVWKTKQ